MGRKERIRIYLIFLVFSLFSLIFTQGGIQLPPSTLKIDQVFINLPHIDIYFWNTNDSGVFRQEIDSSKLRVNIGEDLTFSETDFKLSKFDNNKEGIAFSILMDISLSVRGEGLKNLKAAAFNLVEKMGSKDKAMVILFGSKVKILIPFTSDKDLLREKIDKVSATDKNTVLYKAIDAAFSQNKIYDETIPKRKAIIVVSDGRDEGSGITIDDLKEKEMFPVYSIGFNRGKEEFIEELVRISNISGGQYFHLTKIEDAKVAYSQIREFIKNQWHLKIKDCHLKPDGIEKKMELLYTGRIMLNSKKTIRMFSNLNEETLKKECPPPKSLWEKIPLWSWIAGGVVLLFIVIIIFIMIKKRRKRREEELDDIADKGDGINDIDEDISSDSSLESASDTEGKPIAVDEEAGPEVPEEDITGKASFSIVQGILKGERKVIPFLNKCIKIGRGGLSNFVIDDSEISSEHAFIVQEKGYCYIQDNNSTNGTYVNGVKIKAVRRLEKGDIIMIGDSKIRFNQEVDINE